MNTVKSTERGRWTLEDFRQNLSAWEGDAYLHPVSVTPQDLRAWGIQIPPDCSLVMLCLVWQAFNHVICQYIGRRATWIAKDTLNLKLFSAFLSVSISPRHAQLLGAQETEPGSGLDAVIIRMMVPALAVHEVPVWLLHFESLDAMEGALIAIATNLLHCGRGLVSIGNLDGSPVSESLRSRGQSAWDQAGASHHRVGGPGGLDVGELVRQELKYLWWHRECHVPRNLIPSMNMEVTSLRPLTEYSYDDVQFGRSLRSLRELVRWW